jgi:hypothetical protein
MTVWNGSVAPGLAHLRSTPRLPIVRIHRVRQRGNLAAGESVIKC